MKIYKKYNLGILVVLIALVGCEPDMDLVNPGAITTGSYYQTSEQLIISVNASYNMLARGGLYGRYGYYSFNSRGDDWVPTDKAVGIAEIIPIANFNASADNLSIFWHWKDMYAGVFAANLALEKINEAPGDIPEDLKNRLRGEAYFLRGFFYMQLGLNFGEEVPYIDETPKDRDDYFRGNSPKGLLYTKIIEDFERAIELLPTRSVMYQNPANIGRATKGSALGYLGKTYLYRPILDWQQPAEFDKAAALFKEIIDSEEYDLVPNFRDNHTEENENNIESIFEVQFKNDEGEYWNEQSEGDDVHRNNSTWRMQEIGKLAGIGGSWWNMTPTLKTYNEFEQGDPRRYMSLWAPGGARYLDGSTLKTYEQCRYPENQFGCRKYCDDFSTSEWESGINDRILRYSDILLSYAECLIEAGDEDLAADYINMVRERANNIVPSEDSILWYQSSPGFIPPVEELIERDTTINGVTINTMTKALRHERFVELFGEYHRYYDLLRWSMGATEPVDLAEILNAPGLDKGYVPGREFLPYPSGEIDINPNIQPGPGNN